MNKWAVILGASSGFGAATAKELAANGYNICGVHLDRRAHMEPVNELIKELEAFGGEVAYFNINAADEEKRQEVVDFLQQKDAGVYILLHSLAFGGLAPFFEGEKVLTQKQLEMTLNVMANSLVYWSQDLFRAGLLKKGASVYAMTSMGSTRAVATYGAVGAAKSTLENYIRQIALELAPYGIRANAIRAGVTITPALEKIPVVDYLVAEAKKKNPSGRLTTPEDVARAILALSVDELSWMTGNVINVDGGEEISV
ncbi:MAG TPA: SDR family oxidoreductase [Firmicutes bacterium]|jgi:enoyl-[acyl-carrier protein] reductase III|nr:SDR family oxidoreductase [Bacillota bacterium]